MAFNVWFVIWPNQKKALGIVDADPETKAKSAKTGGGILGALNTLNNTAKDILNLLII